MRTTETITRQEWAVVTGASGGMGRAFALELARGGHPVLLVARRGDELKQVVEEIARRGGHAQAVAADLATADGVEAVWNGVQALGPVGVW
jgi:short-subunit dehydrogenase